MKRPFTLTVLALLTTLTLVACADVDDGNGNSSGSGSGNDGVAAATFNDADVSFAQAMIPHHEQAVQMAAMARANASTTPVRHLAAAIQDAQRPEIDLMTTWLEDWNEPVPTGSVHGANHDGGSMRDGDLPGMMSHDDMGRLEQSAGVAFDRLFLTMMVEHHEGAIEMAEAEQADGRDPDAMALARRIQAAQTSEIATMTKLLAALPTS